MRPAYALPRMRNTLKLVLITALVVFAVEAAALFLRVRGSGWVTYQRCKQHYTMSTQRKIARELCEIQKQTGVLPPDLTGIVTDPIDGWGDALRFWTDGSEFILASVAGPGEESTSLPFSIPDAIEDSHCTRLFDLRREIILICETLPHHREPESHYLKPEGHKTCGHYFVKWPVGTGHTDYEEGPFGIGKQIGWKLFSLEKRYRGW